MKGVLFFLSVLVIVGVVFLLTAGRGGHRPASTAEVSTASTPKSPDFQVVSVDWRQESQARERDCLRPPCRTYHRQELHAVFKNVGGRGSAIATFTAWTNTFLGAPRDSQSCSVLIPDTATNGIAEAACVPDQEDRLQGDVEGRVDVSYGR